MLTTDMILEEIGGGSIPRMLIFNKVDQMPNSTLLVKLLQKKYPDSSVVSAFSQDDIKMLRHTLFETFTEQFEERDLNVPYGNASAWSLIHKSCVILDASYEKEGSASFHVKASRSVLAKLQEFTTTR